MSVHVELVAGADGDAIRLAVSSQLQERFAIEHVTIQTKRDPCEDTENLHP